ncbi:MAG: phage portal protein, partial [Hominilimicola sp.]
MLFRRKREIRQDANEIIIKRLLGEDTITRDMALNIPSLSGCVNFIADTIAMLPVELYDGTEIAAGDKRVELLNSVTNDTLDAYQMKKAWITDMLLDGEAYIYIERCRNRVNGLYYVPSAKVSVLENTDPIFKDYDISVNGCRYRDFEFLKLTRNTVNGASGRGIVEENAKILLVAYNTLEFENNLVRSGGKKGFIQAENRVEQKVIDQVKEQWRKFYNKNSENIIVLNKGLEFKEASFSSVEIQLSENKKAN